MTRRELLIGSAVTAAAGYLAMEGCETAARSVLPGPAQGYTLNVQYFVVNAFTQHRTA